MKQPHKVLKEMISAGKQIENPLFVMSTHTATGIFGYVVIEFEGIPIEIDNNLPNDNVYLKVKR